MNKKILILSLVVFLIAINLGIYFYINKKDKVEEQPISDEIISKEEPESDINISGVTVIPKTKPTVVEKPVVEPVEEPIQKPVVEEPVVEEPVVEKCKDNQVMRNDSCLKILTKEDCDEFSTPNTATENTSCLPMNQDEKGKYCKTKGDEMIYYENKCRKVLSNMDCIDSSNKVNKLFHQVPNQITKFTSCRDMNKMEKEKVCKQNNMFWNGTDCLNLLKKPIVTIKEILPYSITLNLKVDDFDVSLVSVKYMLAEKENTGELISFNDKENLVIFKISGLKEKTEYDIKVKFLTNIDKYESPYSDSLHFKTVCDKLKYSKIKCQMNYGPKGSIDSNVVAKNKDPSAKSWPYFKIPGEDQCNCREMTQEEKIDYCIDKFYPKFKENNRQVEIVNGKCVPKIITLEAPTSKKLVTPLDINQEVDKEITKIENYRLNYPYRLLLSWERPSLNNTGRGLEAAPSQYNIYRKINEKYEIIKKIKVTDAKQTSFKWVDGDNKKFPKDKFQNVLKPETIYHYMITAVNSAGEGKALKDNGLTKSKLITKEQCSAGSDDSNAKTKFRGYPQVINYKTNSCVPMPPEQRQLFCEKLPKIQEPYPNYYLEKDSKDGKKIRTCAPLVKDLKAPGKPNIKIFSKNSTKLKLTIVPPNDMGIPMLSHYYVTWKNMITGESGRLEDIENKGLLGVKILKEDKYIVEHNNLQPGTRYTYDVIGVSINDKIWRYKSDSILDGRPVGMSDKSSITITTKYTLPLVAPELKKLTESLDLVSFIVNSFPVGKEGGAVKGLSLASIVKYKITKKLLPNDKDINMIESTDVKLSETILSLNNMAEFNKNNKGKIQVSFNSKTKQHTIIDYNIEPQTTYQYSICAMNNKINSWSKIKKEVILKTPTLSPLYTCDNISNLKFKVNLSTNMNFKKVTLGWDKMVDPNINRYKKYPGIYSTKSTQYSALIKNKSDGNNLPLVTSNINSITIDNIIPGKDYIVDIIVEHNGELKLSNGFVNMVVSDNKKLLSDKTRKVLKIANLSQVECNTPTYSDNNSIVNENVYMHLDNTTIPYKCIRKTPILLDTWCKNNKGKNNVYWPLSKKCEIPVDGYWKLILNSNNGPCTSDGNPGDIIRCGSGLRKTKIWKYVEPKFGGKDIVKPTEATLDYPGSNTAYVRETCNSYNCKKLCEDIEFGKYVSSKNVLTNVEFNSNKHCDKKATIGSSLEINNTTLKECTSCGNPDSKRITQDICTDGLYGRPEATNCMARNDIGTISDWKFKGLTKVDTSDNFVKQYSRNITQDCNIDWCDWETSGWGNCDKYCGDGLKSRTVTCKGPGSCNSNLQPSASRSCNNGNCKEMCVNSYKKWKNVKNSLTSAEFKNNKYCETKNQINPSRSTSNSSCTSCGNPSTNYTKTQTCSDGLYGPDSKVKCNKIINMNSRSGWKSDGVGQLDGSIVGKYKKTSSHSCDLKWCEWESGGWSGCSKECDWGTQIRNVSCSGTNKNYCESRKKPSSSTSCKIRDCTKKPANCYACHQYDCGKGYTRSETGCGFLGCKYTCTWNR